MARLSPEFCFTHWNTQCRAAYGGPTDPHLVLGGFPTDPDAFRNYTADATAFVLTLPLDPSPANKCAPLAGRRVCLRGRTVAADPPLRGACSAPPRP